MIAWAMELYEKGIITDKDTHGLKLEWGNDEAVIEMVKQVALREGLGDILGEGPLSAGRSFGPDSMKYLIHVKGMSNLNTDERAAPALALSVAVSSRGSDHLRGVPAIDLYNLPMELLDKIYRGPDGYDGPLTNNFSEYEGKPRMVMWQELCYMAVESLGRLQIPYGVSESQPSGVYRVFQVDSIECRSGIQRDGSLGVRQPLLYD